MNTGSYIGNNLQRFPADIHEFMRFKQILKKYKIPLYKLCKACIIRPNRTRAFLMHKQERPRFTLQR